MGREMKRVPLDFDWPLKETWAGYLNPFNEACDECTDCGGNGYSAAANRLKDQWYGQADFDPVAYGARPLSRGDKAVVEFAKRNVDNASGFYLEFHGTEYRSTAILREIERLYGLWRGQWCHHLIQADVDALIEADRLRDLTHVFVPDEGWKPKNPPHRPTADEVNAWSLGSFGHDGINEWVCVKARLKREGLGSGTCPTCNGEGKVWPSRAHKSLAEAFEDIEPPTGVGYQLWETTSEGSPVSPVFATLDELCSWCESNATTFADERATAAEWRSMLDADFVCHKDANVIFI